jgi:fumarate hydratase class II
MPGKVNPTQAEALMQACLRVIGNDVTISLGGTMGEFQLNVAKPLIISTLLESTDILAETARAFDEHLAKGIRVNKERIKKHLDDTLMLVTALVPHIGYDKAAKIALQANRENRSLKDVAKQFGINEKDFDKWVDPKKMV